MKNAVPGAKTGSKPSSVLEMLGQDPSSFFPFWPNACLCHSAGQRSSRGYLRPKWLPAWWWAFLCEQKVQCQTHPGRSRGGPVPGTSGLGCPVQAVTVRGHSLYVNAPSSLRKKCRVPLGSPGIETTLTRLPRLGTDLDSPKWPCWTDTYTAPSPPACAGVRGGHFSGVPSPLGTFQRSSRDAARAWDFFSPFVALCGERGINTVQLSRLLAYCLTVLMHVRILVLLSAKANCLGLLYFNTGNPKQWEECTIM